MNTNPTILIILDGFGYTKNTKKNAVYKANMPNWKRWLTEYPNTLLKASGEAVGLPPKYIGNSEVGHLTIGTGRIIPSILSRFNDYINSEEFYRDQLLLTRFQQLKKTGKNLHVMGLLSDAGVHSHEKHMYAFIKLAYEQGIKNIYVHAFLDGRDTIPKSAPKFLKRLQKICAKYHCTIASIHGRFYAMDRDKNWDRTEKSYAVLTKHTPIKKDFNEVLQISYKNGISDEFIIPTSLCNKIITNDDGVIFTNFREDRAQQLTEKFLAKDNLAFFISTTRYNQNFKNNILFKIDPIRNSLLDILNNNNKTVFITAETEKYAHITYFFNGLEDKQSANTERVLIHSLKLKTYEEQPEMSASKITAAVIKSLQTNTKDFYLINYANADMVGHSANFNSTVKACECLDKQLKTLYEEVIQKQNGTLFITADHGNAEEPQTHHTTNPVPFMIINKQLKNKKINNNNFELKNIAATILKHMNIKIPDSMASYINISSE